MKTTALITPSYAADFGRCQVLCESIDAFVSDAPDHYILVDNSDFSLFSSLAGTRRHIINELDILPSWLHSTRLGLGPNARKVWWSTRTWPMRGWHIQQLRRIAIAAHIDQDAALYCDSDMMFVKEFSTSELWEGDALRLYQNPNGIHDGLINRGRDHMKWTSAAASLLGLPHPEFPAHDYINNLVSWRRQDVVEMCSLIEKVSGKHWAAAIGAFRSFSECQIYGAYVDTVLKDKGHWVAPDGLCQTYWFGEAMSEASLQEFVSTMQDSQVAIGVQSFTGTDPAKLRVLLP